MEKIDPLLDWVCSEFGFKPIVYSSFFGGKQEDGLIKAVEDLLRKTDDCELASIDAIASAAHSLIIAIGIFRGKLQIEEAIELIRLEEDLQVLLLSPSFFIMHKFILRSKTLGCHIKKQISLTYSKPKRTCSNICRWINGVWLKVVTMLILLIYGFRSHLPQYFSHFQGNFETITFLLYLES